MYFTALKPQSQQHPIGVTTTTTPTFIPSTSSIPHAQPQPQYHHYHQQQLQLDAFDYRPTSGLDDDQPPQGFDSKTSQWEFNINGSNLANEESAAGVVSVLGGTAHQGGAGFLVGLGAYGESSDFGRMYGGAEDYLEVGTPLSMVKKHRAVGTANSGGGPQIWSPQRYVSWSDVGGPVYDVAAASKQSIAVAGAGAMGCGAGDNAEIGGRENVNRFQSSTAAIGMASQCCVCWG